jgi:hypothetical protein
MKTCRYAQGDKEKYSIDRIDSKQGPLKDNIQRMCQDQKEKDVTNIPDPDGIVTAA